ncbi:hypothetical protein CPC16_005427, partial [Podila verticillata]
DKDKDTKKALMKSTQVFGGSLTVECGRTIPNVVELCVKTIEARGLSTAGIYRVSGHMSSIQNLKRAFNEGLDVEKLIEKEPDINTIAALLKLYFRELREPLMLFDFYPSFIAAADEDGSMYFFNSSTGETTWDKPTSRGSTDTDHSRFQSSDSSELRGGPFDSDMMSSTMVSRATPKRQSSVDESMLQSQLLSLSLSDEELNALALYQLPTEHIQRRGSLRVKSQKVSSNATISSWKDYWVVVYKGFLLFYRDDSGAIKGAYSLKSSSDSMNKIRYATQVKPSGCFDAGKVAVDLATKDQALTKKKNVFYLTPGTSVRLLLQDSAGNDEKAWVRDIQTSLASRRADESSGSEESYLIQILRRQTSGGGEASVLKMNKKIEEKDLKSSTNKNHNPLKLDKARGIRSMVAQGIHVPRRKSAQDERFRLPDEDTLVDDSHDALLQSHKPSGRPIPTSTRTSSRDYSKDFKKDSEQDSISSMVSSPNDASGSPSSGGVGGSSLHLSGAAHNTKVKFSNM